MCFIAWGNYLLTPWSRVLFEKLTGFQLVKKFPAFYGTRMFITVFTSARHLFLSWATSIQSIPPHPTSWRSILILSSHLRLGLPSGLFPSGFPTTPLLSPIRATCPTRLIRLDSIIRTMLGEEYRLLSSSLCSFLHSHGKLQLTRILVSINYSLHVNFMKGRSSVSKMRGHVKAESSVFSFPPFSLDEHVVTLL
jgi:hypothetical protein